MHVHEYGNRLAQYDAGPHYHVPQLPFEEWDTRENTQWNLWCVFVCVCVNEVQCGSVRTHADLKEHCGEGPGSQHQ